MNKLHDRWKSNGTWSKLQEVKEIFVEPRNNSNLPAMMRAYRNVIKESSSKSFRVVSGAIFFAVYRGKVAEGIDFSDNEARCVLAVNNIPYFILILFTCLCIYLRAYTRLKYSLLGRHTV